MDLLGLVSHPGEVVNTPKFAFKNATCTYSRMMQLSLLSLDEIVKCDHLNKSFLVELTFCAVYHTVCTNWFYILNLWMDCNM